MSFYKEVPGRQTTLESTLKFDIEPKAGSTNPVTSDGVKSAIDGAVGDAAENLQYQIDEIAEKAGSGYIPKGEATVATLNALSVQENGDLYTMTDAGTLTEGSLAVVAGDMVAWDATNSVWYKAMDYAPRQYGTNEVHNLPTTNTASESDIVSGNYFALDGSAGTKKLDSTTLLAKTAQNALAGNVAQAFDPTRNNTNPYKAGESVVYEGKTYTFKVDHYGAWSASDADELPMDWIYGYNTEFLLKADNGKNLFNKNTKNKAVGKYVNYSSGNMGNVANYTAFVVLVSENTDISVRYASVHVAAFSGIPFLPYCNNGSQAGYISGFLTNNNPGGKTWTTPLGTKCIVVSYDNSLVDDGQVELSSTPTTFEPFKTGLDYTKILDAPDFGGQITALENELKNDIADTQIEVDTFYLKGDTGKNLFNKNTKNKAAGKYVNYSSGNMGTTPDFSAFVVPVSEGDHLSFRGTTPAQIHVALFTALPDLNNYSKDAFVAGGFSNTYTQDFVVPAGVVALVVSVYNSYIDSIQIEKGSSSTAYEEYKFGIDASRVFGLGALIQNKTKYVGAGMTYTTIQSAVDAAEDGDTIVVLPGVYNEAVDVHSSGKMLSIVGTCRDKCILTYSSGDYYKAPLEIGQGYVANLTIKATGSTLDEGATMFAYCVHVDYNEEESSALQFVNCVFENDARECVGIGLRENFSLSFKSCSFTNYNLTNSEQARVFYCHEGPGSNHTNQKCELIDCTLFSASTARAFAVVLQAASANTGNDATFLIQRSICKTNGTWWSLPILMWDITTNAPASGGSKWKGSDCWNLDVRSDLNNESAFNA